MKTLKHIWYIALKDLKVFVTDRIALFFFILFPFLFITLFNFLLGSAAQRDDRLELHLVTLEPSGGISRSIIDNLETKDDTKLKAGEVKIIWDRDYNKALYQVQQRNLDGFILFPEDFTKGIQAGYGARIEVFVNPEATNTRPALKAVADGIASAFGLSQAAKNAATGLLVEQAIDRPITTQAQVNQMLGAVMGGVGVRSSPVKFEVEKIGEAEASNPSNYVIPGYLVMFVFLAAAAAAESIVKERQNHTLERLLVSSVKKVSILGGLFAGTAVKGLLQIAIFWTAGIFLYKVDMGVSPFAVILLSVLMVIMSAAFAVMLATLVKSQRAASSLAVLTSLTLAPLGGCWWPLFVTPRWMQFVARLTPHGWANTGFNNLMVFGGEFNSAVPAMLALIGFTVAFAIAAGVNFRTSEG